MNLNFDVAKEDFEKYTKVFYMNLNYKVFKLSAFNVNACLHEIQSPQEMANWKHFDIIAIPTEQADQIAPRFTSGLQ